MNPPSIIHEAQPAPARSLPGRRKRLDSIAALELRYLRILQDNLAILRGRRIDELRQRRLQNLASHWPLWLGILLGALAPQLQAVAQTFGDWGMTLAFPFVALANRPEMQFGQIVHLPTIMLFAQFPLEGLVARILIRRGGIPLRVVVEVALIHCFGILDLWLLSAGPATMLMH
jgi:hypothetical protein